MEKSKEFRSLDFEEYEIREADDKSYLTGYALKWMKRSVDLGGFVEQFKRGSFSESLSKRGVLAFYNHNPDLLLGNTRNKTLTIEEDNKGLRFDLELPNTTIANDAKELVKRGDIPGMSFAFRSGIETWDETGEIPLRTISNAELFEVSLTASPAYPQTTVKARNSDSSDNAYIEYRRSQQIKIDINAKIRENIIKNQEVL